MHNWMPQATCAVMFAINCAVAKNGRQFYNGRGFLLLLLQLACHHNRHVAPMQISVVADQPALTENMQ